MGENAYCFNSRECTGGNYTNMNKSFFFLSSNMVINTSMISFYNPKTLFPETYAELKRNMKHARLTKPNG
jgi:hypothetical protein